MITLSPFSGTSGVSAARWLRSLAHSLPSPCTPTDYLTCIDGLLTGEAARWADQHPRIRQILNDEDRLQHATQADVETVRKALKARFPVAEECSGNKSGLQLMFLRQGEGESLACYYRRTEALLHAIGAVDRTEAPLTEGEEAGLKDVMEKFVHGLREEGLREAVLRYWQERTFQPGISPLGLEEVYQFAKCVFDKSEFVKAKFGEAYEGESGVHPDKLNSSLNDHESSSPPELSFTGLYGSSGKSHDSFTKADYGSYQTSEESVYVVSGNGIAVVREGLAKHWAIEDNTVKARAPTPDPDAFPATSKGKVRLVHISAPEKESVSAGMHATKTAAVAKSISTGTPLSDVEEEAGEHLPAVTFPSVLTPARPLPRSNTFPCYSENPTTPARAGEKTSSRAFAPDSGEDSDDSSTVGSQINSSPAMPPPDVSMFRGYSTRSGPSGRAPEEPNIITSSSDSEEDDVSSEMRVPRVSAPAPSVWISGDPLSYLSRRSSHIRSISGPSFHNPSSSIVKGDDADPRIKATRVPVPALLSSASSSSFGYSRTIGGSRGVLRTTTSTMTSEAPASSGDPEPRTSNRSSTPERPKSFSNHTEFAAHSLGSDLLSAVNSQKARRGIPFSNLRIESDAKVTNDVSESSSSLFEMSKPIPPPRVSSQAMSQSYTRSRSTKTKRQQKNMAPYSMPHSQSFNTDGKNGDRAREATPKDLEGEKVTNLRRKNEGASAKSTWQVSRQTAQLEEKDQRNSLDIPNFQELTSGQRLSWDDPYIIAPSY